MNILVIKQTSLGDVLHSTGHVRAIKRQYPDSRLVLLTADTSVDIYRANPWVDEIVQFQRYRVKADWWRRPLWTIGHIVDTARQVRRYRYDIAIDLQGRWKSVLFLYLVAARRKLVKGRWPFLDGFRDRSLHALEEMDRVLERAGIDASDTGMEFAVDDHARGAARGRLVDAGGGGDYVVISPFTRWPSKNWSLTRYRELLEALPAGVDRVLTGAASDREQVATLEGAGDGRVVNLCGRLDLQEFAALVGGARAMISGDSFAMHLAVACQTPVVALFGPTDETRVGPVGPLSRVLRGDDGCSRCYRRDCPRRCIDAITPAQVISALSAMGCEGFTGASD